MEKSYKQTFNKTEDINGNGYKSINKVKKIEEKCYPNILKVDVQLNQNMLL